LIITSKEFDHATRDAQLLASGYTHSSKGNLKRRTGCAPDELAEKTGRPPQTFSLIINGRKGISEETAVDLEEAFDGELSAEFWMNLETHYRLHKERLKRRERKAG